MAEEFQLPPLSSVLCFNLFPTSPPVTTTAINSSAFLNCIAWPTSNKIKNLEREMIAAACGQKQTEWTVGMRRDAPPCSPHGLQFPLCTVLFSKEPAALVGSTTGDSVNWLINGLMMEMHQKSRLVQPTLHTSSHDSLEQLRLASDYCLASASQHASRTAAFQSHLSKLSHYQQQTPETTSHL